MYTWEAIGEAVRKLPAPLRLVLEYETVKEGKILEELIRGNVFVKNWLSENAKIENVG